MLMEQLAMAAIAASKIAIGQLARVLFGVWAAGAQEHGNGNEGPKDVCRLELHVPSTVGIDSKCTVL